MKKLFLAILTIFCVTIAFPQEISLTFTAKDADSQDAVGIDSVLIGNLTQLCDTTIAGPIPSLIIPVTSGVYENNPDGKAGFQVLTNMPNPFSGATTAAVYLPVKGELLLILSDAAGHMLAKFENEFNAGLHKFEISSFSPGFLFLNAYFDHETRSVKLVSNSTGSGSSSIRYSGQETDLARLRVKSLAFADGQQFRFNLGDQLQFTATAEGYENGVLQDSPIEDTTYVFQMTALPTLPIVFTSAVTDTTQTTAICGGNVTDDGGLPVTARGVCWSLFPEPTLSGDFTIDGSGTGEFTSELTGLIPQTVYYVRAYATNGLGTAYGDELSFTTKTQIDPMLLKLAGETSKNWKLIRVVNTGRYPIEVGPYDHSTIWWAMGLNNDELAHRPCMLNDEWIFYPDGTMEFNANGDYWAEGGVFDPANFCASTSEPMISVTGEDVSAWGNGTHNFELIPDPQPKLKAVGQGAYIGFFKCANDYEVYDLDPMVQDEITYKLIKLSDAEAGTDTLIVELDYYDTPGDLNYLGYWRHVLVHYDNPADEPPIPSPLPNASFSYSIDSLTVSFQNLSAYATSYFWNFGDGTTSTEEDPFHTYSTAGMYLVSLTAYNVNGQNSDSQYILLSSGVLTEEILTAGPWKLQVTGHACYVGPAMGSDAWWITPLAFLDGTMIGTPDDWSCMTDDEFIFYPGGGYEYKTNGGSRNDGYMGTPNGCWTDAEIAASPGAPFGSYNAHSFEFTPAAGSERPIITLTNGAEFAAFIGFMKGYYGGENTYGGNPPNGGNPTNRYEVMAYSIAGDKKILIVTVDITIDHTGTAAWTMELER